MEEEEERRRWLRESVDRLHAEMAESVRRQFGMSEADIEKALARDIYQGRPYLPEAPTRYQFPDDESFEEAMGDWRSRVGRIKAMVAQAKERDVEAWNTFGRTLGLRERRG